MLETVLRTPDERWRPAPAAYTGGVRIDQYFQEHVPGAAGQPHTTIVGASHFLQEDKGPELAQVVVTSSPAIHRYRHRRIHHSNPPGYGGARTTPVFRTTHGRPQPVDPALRGRLSHTAR